MLGMSTQVRSVVRLCGSGGPLTCKPPSSAGAAPRGRFTAGYNVAAAPVNQACATTASNLIDFNDDRGGAATAGMSYASAASQAAGMPHHPSMSMAWVPSHRVCPVAHAWAPRDPAWPPAARRRWAGCMLTHVSMQHHEVTVVCPVGLLQVDRLLPAGASFDPFGTARLSEPNGSAGNPALLQTSQPAGPQSLPSAPGSTTSRSDVPPQGSSPPQPTLGSPPVPEWYPGADPELSLEDKAHSFGDILEFPSGGGSLPAASAPLAAAASSSPETMEVTDAYGRLSFAGILHGTSHPSVASTPCHGASVSAIPPPFSAPSFAATAHLTPPPRQRQQLPSASSDSTADIRGHGGGRGEGAGVGGEQAQSGVDETAGVGAGDWGGTAAAPALSVVTFEDLFGGLEGASAPVTSAAAPSTLRGTQSEPPASSAAAAASAAASRSTDAAERSTDSADGLAVQPRELLIYAIPLIKVRPWHAAC